MVSVNGSIRIGEKKAYSICMEFVKDLRLSFHVYMFCLYKRNFLTYEDKSHVEPHRMLQICIKSK